MNTDMNKEVIGMLHTPINTMLAAPVEWRRALDLPELNEKEYALLHQFDDWKPETLSDPAARVEEALTKLWETSFFCALRDRMYGESYIYLRQGIKTFQLENVGAPYFRHPSVAQSWVFAIMAMLAKQLRREYCSDYRLGLQILSFSDPLAMSAACYADLDYIRSEGSLYEGERPEGRNHNEGNLAQLYFQRERLARLSETGKRPKVFVDLQKKHTVFSEGLKSLDVWIDNLIFQKLEGVVITGTGTGVPVREVDLAETREAVDHAKAQPYFPKDLQLPLIAGSGITVENAAMYRKYVDAVIVGSTLKENGYWECRVDPERVKRFMEAWNR